MFGLAVPLREADSVENDAPGELGWCVVQDDDVRIPNPQPAGQKGRQPHADLEAGRAVEPGRRELFEAFSKRANYRGRLRLRNSHSIRLACSASGNDLSA
jgi:hypothetical protein